MAHFAELDQNNIVINILVYANDDIIDEDGNESELIGISKLKQQFGSDTNWKQTSYNNNFRCRYAPRNGTYDESLDVFLHKKPFESWTLNETTYEWEAPFPCPTDGLYRWNEDNYQSDNTTGWVNISTSS